MVDSATQIPGEESTFFLDNFQPSSCELGLIFVGHKDVGERSGLYLVADGEIFTLVNEDTLIQGVGGTLENINPATCDRGRVAFGAKSSLNGQGGVYEWEDGAVRVLADISTLLPGTSHPVAGLGSPSVSGATTSFRGLEAVVSVESLFVADGDSFQEIADTLLIPPGQASPFSTLTAADNALEVVFRGIFPGFTSGVYAWSDAGLRVVADYSTPILDRPGVYLRGFGVPRTSGEGIAFVAATTEEGQGIYVASSEGVRTLIPHLAPLPGGGALAEVSRLDIHDDTIAFTGYGLGEFRPRLLLWREGQLEQVLAQGDVLDGQAILNFNFSLEYSRLAVWVLFEDSSAAIYSVNVGNDGQAPAIPALGVMGYFLLAAALALISLAVLRSSGAWHGLSG